MDFFQDNCVIVHFAFNRKTHPFMDDAKSERFENTFWQEGEEHVKQRTDQARFQGLRLDRTYVKMRHSMCHIHVCLLGNDIIIVMKQ